MFYHIPRIVYPLVKRVFISVWGKHSLSFALCRCLLSVPSPKDRGDPKSIITDYSAAVASSYPVSHAGKIPLTKAGSSQECIADLRSLSEPVASVVASQEGMSSVGYLSDAMAVAKSPKLTEETVDSAAVRLCSKQKSSAVDVRSTVLSSDYTLELPLVKPGGTGVTAPLSTDIVGGASVGLDACLKNLPAQPGVSETSTTVSSRLPLSVAAETSGDMMSPVDSPVSVCSHAPVASSAAALPSTVCSHGVNSSTVLPSTVSSPSVSSSTVLPSTVSSHSVNFSTVLPSTVSGDGVNSSTALLGGSVKLATLSVSSAISSSSSGVNQPATVVCSSDGMSPTGRSADEARTPALAAGVMDTEKGVADDTAFDKASLTNLLATEDCMLHITASTAPSPGSAAASSREDILSLEERQAIHNQYR